MQYLFADITVTPYSETAGDILAAMLGEIGFDSFEMTDTGLKAYIPTELFDAQSLEETLSAFFMPGVTLSHSIHTLDDKDWNEAWEQQGFDPVLEREYGIKLNPRMAFGSGSHDTTHQLVSLLFQQDFSGQYVLDMGTGTGVLAIAMALRGAEAITAIDIDEHSVENAIENMALNHITHAHVKLGDATSIEGTFHTIVANIHKNILIADLPIYVQHLAPGGQLILSGFFIDDVPDMEKAARENQLSVRKVVEQNSWAVMVLGKDSDTNL